MLDKKQLKDRAREEYDQNLPKRASGDQKLWHADLYKYIQGTASVWTIKDVEGGLSLLYWFHKCGGRSDYPVRNEFKYCPECGGQRPGLPQPTDGRWVITAKQYNDLARFIPNDATTINRFVQWFNGLEKVAEPKTDVTGRIDEVWGELRPKSYDNPEPTGSWFHNCTRLKTVVQGAISQYECVHCGCRNPFNIDMPGDDTPQGPPPLPVWEHNCHGTRNGSLVKLVSDYCTLCRMHRSENK